MPLLKAHWPSLTQSNHELLGGKRRGPDYPDEQPKKIYKTNLELSQNSFFSSHIEQDSQINMQKSSDKALKRDN
ncbi:hypothetical protein [Legionella busanensis]|nr:hypothetical protein [Legionella busanensis]